MEHEDVICPLVQILDAPVPQLGEQLVDFFRSLDTQLPVEQVIDVPKIYDDSIQPRIVDCDLRCPQIVEQLVEVPTLLSFASLQQQTAEHIVDIPVPHGRWGSGGGGLHGFLPEQNSTVFIAEQLVDDPVRSGGLCGVLPVQGSTAFGGAEHLALGGSLHGTGFFGAQHVHHQDFFPGQSSTAVRRDGGPVGGPQNFVPGQSSTALGEDDVEDLIWHSQELLEYTRREYSFSSEEEEVEEEETEQMDLEKQPSRFQGHFAPQALLCLHPQRWSLLAGLVVHFRVLV